jgi:mRNA interferase RelE/StbE
VRVSFEASFARDLKGIKDRILLKQVEQVIAEVKTATALSEVKHLSKMRGHATLYRLRLGDYRIGIEVVEDEVIFVRILHRKDIYRYFL